ncbi:uncharacterized protein [Eschrichtius robustus]|uniref:uncharacterized protein n=1 Tax=Eschrichtius robustus TaxID=9764 RepID=UPI0035C03E1A
MKHALAFSHPGAPSGSLQSDLCQHLGETAQWRKPALLPGKWITSRKSGLREEKKATFRLEWKPSQPSTVLADRTLDRPHPRSPARLPLPSLGGRPRSAGFHRPLHARSSCTRRLQPREQRDSGLRAPPLLHRWLRVPLGPAQLGSGARARRAAFPFSSATAPRAAPPGHTHVRSSFPWFTDFRGRRISPRSLRLSASLPLPSRLPLPVGARAHAHTHTHTRRRAGARPRALSRGVSSAAQQIPLSPAPLLTQASSRHWASSVCDSAAEAAVGKVAAARRGLRPPCPGPSPGRSGEGGRRGEEEPRRARVRAAGCLRYRYRGPRFPHDDSHGDCHICVKLRGASWESFTFRHEVLCSQHDAILINRGGESAHHVQLRDQPQRGSVSLSHLSSVLLPSCCPSTSLHL